jgi:hypothetical protein
MLDSSDATIDIVSPYHLVAAGLMKDGTKAGDICHQFIDTPKGLEIRLHLEFPAVFTDEMIVQHQEHFSIEFSNAIKKVMERHKVPLTTKVSDFIFLQIFRVVRRSKRASKK